MKGTELIDEGTGSQFNPDDRPKEKDAVLEAMHELADQLLEEGVSAQGLREKWGGVEVIEHLHKALDYIEGDSDEERMFITPVLQKLDKVAQEKRGSYILNRRLGIIVDHLHASMDGDFTDQFDLPYQIKGRPFYMAPGLRGMWGDSLDGKSDWLYTDLGNSSLVKGEFVSLNPDDLLYAINSSDLIVEEEAHDIFTDFMYAWSPFILSIIKSDFDIEMNRLIMPEQVRLLSVLLSAPYEEALEIKEGVENFGTPFLRAFLAAGPGSDIPKKILAIAKSPEREMAVAVFNKYAELVDTAIGAAEEISQIADKAGEGKTFADLIGKVTEHLLEKGRDLLEKSSADSNAVKNFDRIIGSTLLYASICKEAKKSGTLSVREIISDNVESKFGNELDDDERGQMRDIFKRNRTGYDANTLRASLEDFEEALSDEKSEFYILKRQDRIMSFIRVRRDDNNESYIGSYNTDPDLQGYALGGALFDKIFYSEVEAGRAITGKVVFDNKQLDNYVNKYKWLVTGTIEEHGAQYYSLRREAGIKRDGVKPVEGE